ncbi:MAG: molybdopterin-dependent oxidoreductase, partial [Oscillospiraceae bacterium]|nr:molybdopterin-dependent oxidoreductase [Oscillospiraceae bacterium]
IAIGQKLNASGFEGLELTKRGTLSADEHTFRTNLDGVFAIGDATNKGADIAAAAIGEAQRAAGMADRYLNGETLTYEEPYLVTAEKTAADFAGREKLPRAKMPCRPAGERRNDFLEVSPGLSEEDAAKEAARCLECGCMDYFECKLLDYANRYNVRPERYAGKTHRRAREDGHPNIRRNPDKCILCGLCVRICDEVVGVGALGFVDRGFDTIVKPAFDADLRQSGCIACGQCVHVCPTGALTEVTPLRKQVPLKETFTGTVCASCSAGCGVTLASRGNLLTRALPSPEKGSLLCTKGRFGFGEIAQKERLTVPLIRGKDAFKETSFEQAVVYANKSLQSLQTQYGGDCVAVAVSGRYTNEEAFLVKEYAQKALKTDKIFSLSIPDGGPGGVLGRDIRTATLDEMENTGLVVALEPFKNREVAAMRIRRAVANGAKLLLLSPAPDGEETLLGGVAALRIDMGGGLPVLEKIVRALLDGGHGKGIEGREELLASLGGVTADEEAQMAAEMIIKAKKAVFIFEKDAAPAQIARLIPDMAVLSGHASGPRNGVIQLLPEANSQGLTDLGFGSAGDFTRAVAGGGIRGLFVFGEELDRLDLGALDFLAVQDLHMTETAKRANAVFPASSFAETDGSFTGSDGRTRLLKKAVACPAAWDTMTLIKALAAHAGLPVPYQTAGNVRRGMVETRASCV